MSAKNTTLRRTIGPSLTGHAALRAQQRRCALHRVPQLAVLVFACCGGAARGESGQWLIKTTEPDPITGTIVSFSIEDGLRVQANRAEHTIATDDLVRMTLAPPDEKRNRRDKRALLRNGDLLFGKLKEGAGERLTLEVKGIGDVLVDLEALEALELSKSRDDAHAEALQWFSESKSHDDRVLLTNGDVLSGFITRIDSEGVVVDGALGENEVPLRLVVAIRFGALPRPRTADQRCIVHLRDGGRVSARTIEFDADSFAVNPHYATAFKIPADRIARVEFSGGRWEWLAERTPISFEHTPMLGLPWEPVRNERVTGGPLVVAGQRFDHGIGVHSRSSLTYDLESRYDTFVTSFGLDDECGSLGVVDVFVRVDGQEQYAERGVRPGTLHGPIRIDVRGAKRIELLVDFGGNGDIQDRFNWIEPALIR